MTLINIPKKIDVSVIIPTYNYGNYLNACLASVYNQKGINIEIIVVDDGSTDNTREVLKIHQNKITYIYQENSGPTAARNNGLRACSGQYIQLLDADDLLGKDCIAERVNLLNRFKNNGVAVCQTRLFSNVIGPGIPQVNGWWKLFQEDLKTHLCRSNIAPPHAYLFPRKALIEAGDFDENIKACEDYDYWLKLLGKGFPPIYCPKGMVFYRKHIKSRGAEKSRKGGYYYDVAVHERKLLGEYGEGVTAVLNSPEGLVSFCDGLLCTAVRIDNEVNGVGKLKLINILNDCLDKFIDSLSVTYTNLPLSAKINLMRLLSRNQLIRSLHNERLSNSYNVLNKKVANKKHMLDNIKISAPYIRYDDQSLAYFTVKNIIKRE